MILPALAILSLLILYILSYYKNVSRYPKGPVPLPLIGNLHQIEMYKTHLYLERLSKVYGPVFTIFLPKPTVVITRFDAIKEALLKKGSDFAGRPDGYPDVVFQGTENGGIIFSQGENWMEQRRTSLHILRDLGLGKNVVEQQVLRSVDEFLHQLEAETDKDHVDFRWPIQFCVANVITEILFGYHHDHNDCEEFKRIAEIVRSVVGDVRSHKMIYFAQQFPIIAKIPIVNRFGVRRITTEAEKVKQYVRSEVDKHIREYDANSQAETFIHAYLSEMAKVGRRLSYEQLVDIATDFFLAGMETTTTTLRWGVLLMVAYNDVQEKMREEIFSIVGREREVRMVDKPNMPYCSAVIMEVQRIANILPFNVLHRTLRETTIANKQIPNDTLVLAQISTILSSSPVFEEPNIFQPMRFLHEDGKTFRKDTMEHFIPFGIGKRQCAGEPLARVELFLIFTNLLRKYRLEVPPDGYLPNLDPIPAALAFPRNYNVKIVPL